MIQFNCSKCGQCCQHIRSVVMAARSVPDPDPYTAEIAMFPHDWKPDGSCSQLTEDLTCQVYDHRPDVCNIETVWKKYRSHLMTKEDYFNVSENACKVIQAATASSKSPV